MKDRAIRDEDERGTLGLVREREEGEEGCRRIRRQPFRLASVVSVSRVFQHAAPLLELVL
jgi:hypothetical protein